MNTFEEYLETIKEEEHRLQLQEIFDWVNHTFPNLKQKIAWNQPMFTDHETYIIGFSASKQHYSISPEIQAMNVFCQDIENSGYSQTKNLYRVKWTESFDYELLKQIISYNIADKISCTSFWRK